MSTIGERIKFLRENSNMSQEDLGKRLGVGRGAINKYEKGTVENIPIKSIEIIADIFGATPHFIVGWGDPESNTPIDIRITKGIKYKYGQQGVNLIQMFDKLDKIGQRKTIQYLEDMITLHPKEEDNT